MSEWTRRRKAQIQQRLFGVSIAVISAGVWFWLLSYGTEYIWLGIIAVPWILVGLHTALTDKEIFWEMEDEEDE